AGGGGGGFRGRDRVVRVALRPALDSRLPVVRLRHRARRVGGAAAAGRRADGVVRPWFRRHVRAARRRRSLVWECAACAPPLARDRGGGGPRVWGGGLAQGVPRASPVGGAGGL